MKRESRRISAPMEIVDVLFKCVNYPNLVDVIVPIPCSSYTKKYEAYTPNSDGPRRRWKSFEHYKCVQGDPPTFSLPCKLTLAEPDRTTGLEQLGEYWGYIPGSALAVYGWEAYGDPGKPVAGLPEMYVERTSDNGFVPAPVCIEELEARAAKSMLPIIKSELSLVNSLIELRDFKSLPTTVRRVGSYCREVARRIRAKLIEPEITRPLYRLLGRMPRVGSDAYLQTEFNILPAISDVCGIHRTLTQWEKRINDLLTRAGRLQKKHFNFCWSEFPPSEISTKDDGQWFAVALSAYNTDTYYHLRRRVWSEPTTFHAELRYNYIYSDYQRQHAALCGILDSLGVNLNPAIIWNAIPWSFVIDWVLGVSRWLDQFKLTLMEPTINIQSYLWSVKRSRRISVSRFYPAQRTRATDGPEVAIPMVYESSYRRFVGQMANSSILSSGLTLKEVSLGAALAISRRRRRR